MKHVLSDFDLSAKDIEQILTRSLEIKMNPEKFSDALKGKILGMVFQKPSTRTKASFEAAMYQLGGNTIFLDSTNSQISRGESLAETAKVLSTYTNVIAARLLYHSELEKMAEVSKVPVINALTDLYHPCQILADLLTIKEKKNVLNGLKLAYFGDADNNVAHSLMISCSKLGINVTFACPVNMDYHPNKELLSKSEKDALGKIEIVNNPKLAASGADIIYTDTWISMGMESEKEKRIKDLMPYQVNEKILGNAKKNCVVMHSLPAYSGYEITEEILQGTQSVVYKQAENRMHAQKALLIWLLNKSKVRT